MIELVQDYAWAVIRYWWLLVPGLAAQLLDLASRALDKRLRVSRQRVFQIFFLGLLVAQFLAYRDLYLARDETIADLMTPRAGFRRLIPDRRAEASRDFARIIQNHGQIIVNLRCQNGVDLLRFCDDLRSLLSESGFDRAYINELYPNPYATQVVLEFSPEAEATVEDWLSALNAVIWAQIHPKALRAPSSLPIVTINLASTPKFLADGTVRFD